MYFPWSLNIFVYVFSFHFLDGVDIWMICCCCCRFHCFCRLAQYDLITWRAHTIQFRTKHIHTLKWNVCFRWYMNTFIFHWRRKKIRLLCFGLNKIYETVARHLFYLALNTTKLCNNNKSNTKITHIHVRERKKLKRKHHAFPNKRKRTATFFFSFEETKKCNEEKLGLWNVAKKKKSESWNFCFSPLSLSRYLFTDSVILKLGNESDEVFKIYSFIDEKLS